MKVYDQYAQEYDAWFLKSENVLYSEVRLVAKCLRNSGKMLSVGCGSGLFEMILKNDFDIEIKNGIEPASSMAEIARKRGMEVTVGAAEDDIFEQEQYDTVYFNGCPSYIDDLQKALDNAYKALKKGGKVAVFDVPKESAYAILYNLAKTLHTWDHPMLEGIKPPAQYPIEFVEAAKWRTTDELVIFMKKSGFDGFEFYQTLTTHPLFSDDHIEEPSKGYDKGSYVAICAYKK